MPPDDTQAVVPQSAPPQAIRPFGAPTAQPPIHGRYMAAHARPRAWPQVRYHLLHECQQLRFAEASRYDIQRGHSSISGWSIDFATAAARAMQNVWVEVERASETADERLMRVTVTDLESNLGYSQEAPVDRFVLKHMPPKGQAGPQQPWRHNAQGKPLYRHAPSEQELLAATNATVSKLTRNLILKHLPTWLLEDCLAEVQRTIKAGGNKLAGHLPTRMLAAFGDLGVSPRDLDEYLGHDLIKSTPSEMQLLRSLAVALKQEDITWPDALEARRQLHRASGLPAASPTALAAPAPPQAAQELPSSAHPKPPTPEDQPEQMDLQQPREAVPTMAPAPTRTRQSEELMRRLRNPRRGPVPT